MDIVDFGALAASRHGDAAMILRDALAHVPSAYNGPGEAEAELALRCGLTTGSVTPPSRANGWSAGSARSAPTVTAGRSIPWSWRRIASAAASARR